MKTAFNPLTDFDTNSGCSELPTTYKATAPGIEVETGDYIIHDADAYANIGIESWVRFTDVSDSQFRVLLGVSGAGAGKALDFNMTTTSHTVSLTTIPNFAGVASSTVVSKEFYPRLKLNNSQWYKIKITISDSIIRVQLGNYYVFESNLFVATGTNWGFSGMATATAVTFSDTYLYQNQVFYGNVNINGSPNAQGVAVMFDQSDGAVIAYQDCNADGEYAILITDAPAALNKYFLIGFIKGESGIQPRGVGNLTL